MSYHDEIKKDRSPLTDRYARLLLTDDRAGSIEDTLIPYAECARIERELRSEIESLKADLNDVDEFLLLRSH